MLEWTHCSITRPKDSGPVIGEVSKSFRGGMVIMSTASAAFGCFRAGGKLRLSTAVLDKLAAPASLRLFASSRGQ